MNVNVRSGLRLGVILLAVTVGSAAERAMASARVGSEAGVLPPQPSPCFNVNKPCGQPVPPAPTPRKTQR